jgi:hypothetical protein
MKKDKKAKRIKVVKLIPDVDLPLVSEEILSQVSATQKSVRSLKTTLKEFFSEIHE